MRAWESVTVPSLDQFGRAPAVQVHDTATGGLTVVAPEQTARLYVCGITPYDATHLGHAATYVAFDLLNRAWRDAGLEVRYVQNVTDVDDPLLERAVRDGEDWQQLAERETERFRGDMVALRVLPPDDYIGAVESIPSVVEMVQRLDQLGHVYDVDGDLYFSVHSDPAFGDVSNLSEEEMLPIFAERGGDPDRAGKRHPLDCLLWQAARPDEPSWESPFGPGRPGWHIECSAIALGHLGADFDVQGGGSDLAFPHHEMSASEAQALQPGSRFAQAYLHAGMVAYQGEKMSKSLGNLVFVSHLRAEGVEPGAIRLALLAHHYRSDWEWTEADLPAAEKRLARWRDALTATTDQQAAELVGAVRTALALDLDSPAALAAVDAWADSVQGGQGEGNRRGADTVRDLIDARLGVQL